MKVGTQALLFFAMVASVLAAIGIYAVLATFVMQRRREFGIRLALGSTPRQLSVQVLKESALLTSIGTTLGLALSVGMALLMRDELITIDPLDIRLYLAAAAGMALIVALSTFVPAVECVESCRRWSRYELSKRLACKQFR